jgi:two-component system response regulator
MIKHFDVEILLVEDNPQDAELILRAIKKHNLTDRIKILKDGEEALDYLFGTGKFAQDLPELPKPKVIVLDLKLPKVSGIEVLKVIKSEPSTKAIPVVILTSSAEDQDIKECYNLGVNSYVVKPMEFEKFLQAVAHLGFYWLSFNQPPI